MMKKTILCAAVSMIAAQSAMATDLQSMGVEVTPSASVSTDYLLRGQVLGGAAVMGDLKVEHETGVYGVASVVSSDSVEQNYKIGVARDFGDYGVDVGYKGYTGRGMDTDREEVSLDVTRGMASLNVVNVLDTDEDNLYVAGSVAFGSLTGTVGVQTADMGYSHLQVDYSATDNLTFTASKAFDDGSGIDEGVKLVVGYSIPLM